MPSNVYFIFLSNYLLVFFQLDYLPAEYLTGDPLTPIGQGKAVVEPVLLKEDKVASQICLYFSHKFPEYFANFCAPFLEFYLRKKAR